MNALAIFLGSLGIYLLVKLLRAEILIVLTNEFIGKMLCDTSLLLVYSVNYLICTIVTLAATFIVYTVYSMLLQLHLNVALAALVVAAGQQVYVTVMSKSKNSGSGAYHVGMFIISLVEICVLACSGWFEYLIVRIVSGILVCNLLNQVCYDCKQLAEKERDQKFEQLLDEQIRKLTDSQRQRLFNRVQSMPTVPEE